MRTPQHDILSCMTCCIVTMSSVFACVFCTIGVATVEQVDVFVIVRAN